MKQEMPRTPFSMSLSRSARETERRIQNIFAGPRKRPPVLFLLLVFAVCLLCGNLVSCQVAEAEKDFPDSSDPVSSVIPETSAPTREAYARVLEDMFDNNILPDGSAISDENWMTDNQFAIADVDRDGYEELVICFFPTVHAGYRAWVLNYDMETESVRIQYEGYPALTFYDNGAMTERRGGDSRACDLYTYQPETDSYEAADCLGDAQPLTLEYQSMTKTNIQLVRAERLAPSDEYPGLALTPDLNNNGVPEELRLNRLEDWLYFEVWEDGQCIRRESGSIPQMESYWFNENTTALFLCTLEGRDYLLRAHADAYQGVEQYYWSLIDLSGEFEEWPRSGRLDFDLNFDAPYHREFDPEAIAAYAEQFNDLLSHSTLLFNTCPALAQSFEQAGRLEEVMPWLDSFPDIFTRDPDKSLLDNLKDFNAAMTAASHPLAGTPSKLPITEPLTMSFSSGAGAWSTELTLNPDGTFTGDYCDADMEIQYICQFHGRFGKVEKLSESSYSLTLEELVLDTQYPIGSEWDGDGFHYISSNPYGFDDGDSALKPGARFIFYTPEAAGHEPGTELYGAIEFWTWWPNRHIFASEADTLGRYGLNNLETGYGFFS